MIPAYAMECAGCTRRWVAIFDEGCRAPFGVECPGCHEPTGRSVAGPAHFDTAEEAHAYFAADDSKVRRALVSMKAARDLLLETLKEIKAGTATPDDIDYVLTLTSTVSGEGEAVEDI